VKTAFNLKDDVRHLSARESAIICLKRFPKVNKSIMLKNVATSLFGCTPRHIHIKNVSTISLETAKKILRLPPGEFVSEASVKNAFRMRALKLHPDVNPNPSANTDDFKQLIHSYEIALEAASSPNKMKPHPENASPSHDEYYSSTHFAEAVERARVYDEEVREKIRFESRRSKKADNEEAFKERYHCQILRGGWKEEIWESLKEDTGDTVVKSVRVRITEPVNTSGHESSAETHYDEWQGYNGKQRRKTHKFLPKKYSLARKTFGHEQFNSRKEIDDAISEFGMMWVTLKRALSLFPKLGFVS